MVGTHLKIILERETVHAQLSFQILPQHIQAKENELAFLAYWFGQLVKLKKW